ncbi:MAG: hypothetical protein A2286_07585 [Gammaproteobacteria bacterium RIFOXYA12_FULL_61_12]|nr:MAG: hypothetical protein A2514_06350 [Gammaproteobacteria bacterium RIFOXYD12_FULL_61_37]OGT93384.1 MAG: hypothetical protein A2286_07585 [Gammaproteobacteria bacterium RIFOXYA12_FULL_61_12]
MKKFLTIMSGIGLLLVAAWFLAPKPEQPARLTDMPWQIETFEDGTSKALGVHIGKSTLADVIERYGRPEGIALFVNKEGAMSLEAYFDSVKTGPFSAKVILTLTADPAELSALAGRAMGRDSGPSGDQRLLLAEEDKSIQSQRRISGLTYIPAYGQLDADFFRARFGEPRAWRRNSESSVSWFYPDRGLSILLDAEGKEMLQYEAPKDYRGPKEGEGSPAGEKAQ